VTRAFSALMAALVALGLLLVPRLALADTCRDPYLCRLPTVTDSGYRYSYSNGEINRVAALDVRSASGVPMEHFLTPTCWSNPAPGPSGVVSDTLCPSATGACPPGQVRMWVHYRPQGSGAVPRPVPGWRCVGATQSVPAAAVLAGVRESLERLAPKAAFEVQPRDWALVNLPIIVHATSPNGRPLEQPIQFDVTQPVPGHLEAYPTYQWDFGGGTSAEGVGIAYDGTSPQQNPDYYVSHAYDATGSATVTLTILWRATFIVAGLPPFPLEDLPRTAARTFPVLEARSQLVADPS